MNKKLLIFLLVFILSVSVVSAATPPTEADTRAYWKLEDLTDSTGNGNTLTNNGATSGATGIINDAYIFDGTNEYIGVPTTNLRSVWGFSYSIWYYNTRDNTAEAKLFDNGGGFYVDIISGDIRLVGNNAVIASDTAPALNQWNHVVATYDGANLVLYVNGAQAASAAYTSSITYSGNFNIGARGSGSAGFFQGTIDEFFIANEVLTSSQVAYLYNSGSPTSSQQYPFSSAGNVTLTFVDQWNNSINVDDLNVTIDGTTYTNSTGSIIYTDIPVNASQTHDIEVEAHQYFSRTFTSETMEDKTLQLFQSDITFEGRTIVSNTTKAANFTIGSQTNGNFYLTAGTYQVSVQSSPFDKNHTFTVAALDNRTELVYIPDHLLTLGVINNRNSAFINGTKTGWYENTANNFNESFNFTGDTIDIELEAGLTYDFFLNPVGGYATNEGLNFQYTATGTNNTRNFQLFENNSVQFYFKNGDSLAFITSDINASLANANNTYNFNTSNGEYFLSGIDGGTYTLTAQTSGFNPVEVFVTVLNNEYQELNVFFGGDVESRIFTVTDRQGNPIEGVVVTFTRQINGTTVVYGQQTTDFSGGIQMFLNPSDIYDLTAVKAGYNTFSGSVTPFRSSYTINMEQEGSQRFISTFDDISYRNNFSHVQNTTTGEAWFEIVSAAGYLQYWGMSTSYNGSTYFQNNTGTPSGGTIQFNITNINTSHENTLEVVYWFKSVNSSFIQWNETYLINNRLGQDNLGDWDFSDQPTGVKAIITLFIVLLSGGIGIAITRRTLGGVIMGGLGIGFAMIVGWTPLLFGTLTLGVLAIVLISDLSTGENR